MKPTIKLSALFFLLFYSIQLCFGADELQNFIVRKDIALRSKDTAKIIQAYYDLGDYYSDLEDYKKSDSILNICLRFSTLRKDFETSGKINNVLASNASYQGYRKLALAYYDKALALFSKGKDLDGMALIMMNMGSEYEYGGDLEKAMDCKLKALKYKEASGVRKNLDYYYQNIGQLFKEHDTKKWEYYVQKAYLISKTLPESRVQTKIAIFNDLGGIAQAKKEFNKSLIWYDSMILASTKINYVNGLSTAYANRAMVYKALNKQEKALSDITKAMGYDKSLNRNYTKIINKLHAGQILTELKRFPEAKKYLTDALQQAHTIKTYPEEEAIIHNALAVLGEKTGNWHMAHDHYVDYRIGIDSIRGAETNKTIQDLEIKYQTSEKEKKIALLNNENHLKTLQINRNKLIIFILIMVSLVVISLILYFLARNRLKEHQKQAALQQKLLRSQLNPHFIFNAIGSIQSFMYHNDAKTASSYLAKFASLMRGILNQSEQELSTLNEETEMLENYLSLEKLRKNNAFQYKISVDKALDPEEVLIPSMLVQPFVENAIKHAFDTDSEENRIEARFSKKGEMLQVEVEDNGVGINQTQHQEKTHKSMASEIFKHRMKILGKNWENQNSFSVEDLSEKGGNGTRILFTIPILK